MQNYYYSGQGSLYMAERDAATGAPKGFLGVGNVPELSIDIETTEFSHKESESGQRLEDLVITQEKSGTATFTMENVSQDNLAVALWGTTANVAGSSVVGEEHVAYAGKKIALAFPDVSAVVVKNEAGDTTYTVATDYTVDAKNGTITIVSGGTIVDESNIQVDYTYAASKKLEAFTRAAAPERFLRFEGLNTVDESRVIVNIFRARFNPLTGYALINEEIAQPEVVTQLLADPFKTAAGVSKFFQQWNVNA